MDVRPKIEQFSSYGKNSLNSVLLRVSGTFSAELFSLIVNLSLEMFQFKISIASLVKLDYVKWELF